VEAAQAGDRPRDSVIEFFCSSCGRKIHVAKIKAGQKGKCPDCKSEVVVPGAEVKGKIAQEGVIEEGAGEGVEQTGKRKYPWYVDVLLYPISISGVIHLVLFFFLPTLVYSASQASFWMGGYSFYLIARGVVLFLMTSYFFFFIAVCVRDSATGGTRTPNVNRPGGFLDAEEIVFQTLRAIFCVILYIGPVVAYFIITRRADLFFWLLLIFGIISSPMAILATVMFDSLRAMNPVLVLSSMTSVFFIYCLGVLGLCIFLAVNLLMVWKSPFWRVFLFCGGGIYLAMVAAHLLGRFYWRNQEKLNWEV
jgi:DNA-directed RNA polymerase subunit RPC12/RpoP